MHRSQQPRTLSNPRLRVLQAIRDLGGEHVTINQLAEHLGGHPNASRVHLAGLEHDGYITISDVPGAGPGRRPRGHSLTEEGRRFLDPAEATNASLTGAFASYLVRTGHGKEQAREIGRLWGETQTAALAGLPPEDSVDAVVEVLDMLGFDPGRLSTDEGEALVLRSCPLLTGDHSDPTFMCEVHHGMIDGVLRRIGASEGLTLLPFAEPNGCRVEFTDPD